MDERGDHNLRRELGVSRREMLRRSAIAGGTLLWAAPVIQSIGPSAFAQVGSQTYHKCCFCFRPRRWAPAPTTCINNGMPPDADACAAVCANLGYMASDFCESTGPATCDETTGCSCP